MTDWNPKSGRILAETADGITTITINRPDKLNALNPEMRRELSQAIKFFGAEGVSSGLVITGMGRAFSAGEDLEGTKGLSDLDIETAIETFNEVSRSIFATEVPVAAAVNGIAVGGGAEITLACDTRIGGTSAEFFLPENARGLTISNASSYLLPRMLGSRAIGLVLNSPRLKSHEALELGLLDQVVEDDRLLDVATTLVRHWGMPGKSTAQHLRLLRPPKELVEAAMREEVLAGRSAWDRGLTPSGVQAFLDDRVGEDSAAGAAERP